MFINIMSKKKYIELIKAKDRMENIAMDTQEQNQRLINLVESTLKENEKLLAKNTELVSLIDDYDGIIGFKWIPTSERLPSLSEEETHNEVENIEVLVSLSEIEVVTTAWFNIKSGYFYNDYYSTSLPLNVDAWQFLPTHYTGK